MLYMCTVAHTLRLQLDCICSVVAGTPNPWVSINAFCLKHARLCDLVKQSQQAASSMVYHFLLWGDAQHAKLLESPEEGQHHPHGPAKNQQNPDSVGAQNVGAVTHPPAIVPWGHTIRVGCTCMHAQPCQTAQQASGQRKMSRFAVRSNA